MIRSSPPATPPWRRRLRASGVDFAVIGGWVGVLAGASAVWRRGGRDRGRVFRDPATVDLAQFATMVLPVGLYLAAGEAGTRHATAGKRAAGLTVVDRAGRPPSPSRIAVRTAVKLLPWQLAHLSITRAAGLVPGRHAAALSKAGLVTALALATTSTTLALLRPDTRALHDLLAGTRVTTVGAGARRAPGPAEEGGESGDPDE